MDIFDAQSAKPMLIGVEGEPFDSAEYLFELKMDGERCLAYLGHDRTVLVNRRGRPLGTLFPELAELHRQTGNRCIIDGEIIAGTGGKSDFESIKKRNLIKNRLTIQRLSRETPAVFVALDILYLDREQVTSLPLHRRKELLRAAIGENSALAVVRSVDEHGTRLFEAVRKRGLEGIVGKRKDSVYRMGERTSDWVKIKNWLEDDFLVCGYIVSANPRTHVASIVLGQYNASGEVAYKGRVALGLKRREFGLVARQPGAGSHPFAESPPKETAGAVWLRPSLVCTVGFMCWTESLHLRQPHFKGMRPDKSAAEVREAGGAGNTKGKTCAAVSL